MRGLSFRRRSSRPRGACRGPPHAAARALPAARVPPAARMLVPTLLLCAAFVCAQDDADTDAAPRWPADSLPAHLAADDAREIAWAGFLARRCKVRAAIPAMRQPLARLAGQNEIEPELARLQLIDALIRLDVSVPGEELLPHAGAAVLRVPLLILAAKSPEANASYFAARMAAIEWPDLEWRVCGNLLAAQRDPRFVAQCVRQLEFAIDITIRDDVPRPARASSG